MTAERSGMAKEGHGEAPPHKSVQQGRAKSKALADRAGVDSDPLRAPSGVLREGSANLMKKNTPERGAFFGGEGGI